MNWELISNKKSLFLLALCFVFVSTLPLVWVRLFGTTIALYHVMGLVVGVLLIFLPGTIPATYKILKAGKVIWFSICLLFLSIILSYTKSNFEFDTFYFLKNLSFFLISIFSGILVYQITRQGMFPVMAILPAVTSIIFLVFISIQFTAGDIDPIAIFSLALTRGDPDIVIMRLFRATFGAGESELNFRSNLKQSLSLAFIVVIPIGFLALSYVRTSSVLLRYLAIAGIVFSIFMVIVPFSRAAWLSLALMGICFSVAYVRTPIGLAAIAGGIAVVLPALLVIGSNSRVFALLEARFLASDSLDARVDVSSQQWESIGDSPIFGHSEVMKVGAHNVIIDAWAAFGILGMIGSTLFFGAMLAMVVKGVALTLTAPMAQRRVHATIAALLCPALARMVTAPNVTIDYAAWIALGLAVGLAADAWGETVPTRKIASPIAPLRKPAFGA